ncbi:uncharacterized protein LOC135398058 [Ornithodoros turicata]|uniref:uncharacterized protein LOC135398058 n=1 Tax=Ornithodoros turicata TaxID=34597 RepID=UPI00313979E6
MPSCLVQRCRSRSLNKDPGVPFHAFPKYQEQQAKWIEAFGKDVDWIPPNWARVCSKLFRPEDLDRTSTSFVRLRPGAVPTVFLQGPESTSTAPVEEEFSLQPAALPSSSALFQTQEQDRKTEVIQFCFTTTGLVLLTSLGCCGTVLSVWMWTSQKRTVVVHLLLSAQPDLPAAKSDRLRQCPAALPCLRLLRAHNHHESWIRQYRMETPKMIPPVSTEIPLVSRSCHLNCWIMPSEATKSTLPTSNNVSPYQDLQQTCFIHE